MLNSNLNFRSANHFDFRQHRTRLQCFSFQILLFWSMTCFIFFSLLTKRVGRINLKEEGWKCYLIFFLWFRSRFIQLDRFQVLDSSNNMQVLSHLPFKAPQVSIVTSFKFLNGFSVFFFPIVNDFVERCWIGSFLNVFYALNIMVHIYIITILFISTDLFYFKAYNFSVSGSSFRSDEAGFSLPFSIFLC